MLASLRACLCAIVCGGAPTAPRLVESLLDHGMPLWLGYGLTEASPVVTLGRADTTPRGATGRPIPGVEVYIASATREVLVRGANVMCGYVGDLLATQETLRDGRLHTGNLGRLDAEGHLFVTGRLKDITVTPSGEKLSPEEVEKPTSRTCSRKFARSGFGTRIAAVNAHISRLYRLAIQQSMTRLCTRSFIGFRQGLKLGLSHLEGKPFVVMARQEGKNGDPAWPKNSQNPHSPSKTSRTH